MLFFLQVFYAYSQDCSNRLLVKAPEGDAAKRIRLHIGGKERDFHEEDKGQDFILPDDTVIERTELVKKLEIEFQNVTMDMPGFEVHAIVLTEALPGATVFGGVFRRLHAF